MHHLYRIYTEIFEKGSIFFRWLVDTVPIFNISLINAVPIFMGGI
jgi:hypothetical protein